MKQQELEKTINEIKIEQYKIKSIIEKIKYEIYSLF